MWVTSWSDTSPPPVRPTNERKHCTLQLPEAAQTVRYSCVLRSMLVFSDEVNRAASGCVNHFGNLQPAIVGIEDGASATLSSGD